MGGEMCYFISENFYGSNPNNTDDTTNSSHIDNVNYILNFRRCIDNTERL